MPSLRRARALRDHHAAALQMPGLSTAVLGHVGNDPCIPQDGLRRFARGHVLDRERGKGSLALQLARDVGCNPKSAFVLAHKIREALASEAKGLNLNGEVEVDGCYVGGVIRPENRVKVVRTRRLRENRSPDRRVVVALRQRKGRTLTGVFTSEDEGVPMIRTRVLPGAIVFADEASSWDILHGWYTAKRINHSIAFSDDGVCTNQAESFFSRLRRMIGGQHHRVSARHLHAYAAHAAWLEDHRRLDNGMLVHRALGLALGHGISRQWKGYWQRKAA
jgi:ISXO2-like transposase domain